MKKILLAAIAFTTVLVSCQKEGSFTQPVNEKMKLLTEKDWVVLKAEEKNDVGVWEDVFPQFETCLQDNRFKFNSNLTVVYSEGANACAPNTPNQVIETATWKFNSTETAIITDGIENKIIQLDASRLVVTTIETDAGVTYERRTTYGH